MMKLRMMIAAWIVENDCSGPWLLRLLAHLTDKGVAPDIAIEAMTGFVDDALRTTRRILRPVPASPHDDARI